MGNFQGLITLLVRSLQLMICGIVIKTVLVPRISPVTLRNNSICYLAQEALMKSYRSLTRQAIKLTKLELQRQILIQQTTTEIGAQGLL